MLGDHVLAWLKWGQYPVYEARGMFSDIGLPYPFQNWGGLQRIIDWIMRSSAAGFLFWLALGVGLISGNALEKHGQNTPLTHAIATGLSNTRSPNL